MIPTEAYMTESPPNPDSGNRSHPPPDPAESLNHHHHMNPHSLPHSLRRVYSALGVFTLLMIVALIYALFTGFRMTGKHASRIAAANDIKLLTTTAHLWFEEILHGDSSQSMEHDVLAHLRNADMDVEILLEGGNGPGGHVFPLKDKTARQNMSTLRAKLAEFLEITNRRWEASQSAAAGTEIDQQYDAMFAELMQIVDEVQAHVQRLIARDLNRFKIDMFALMALVTLGGLASGRIITSYFRHSHRAAEALHKSEVHNRTIVESALDCIITMDHTGRITEFNPAAEHTFGYSRQEVLGQDLAKIIIPERRSKAHHQGLKRYLHTGSSDLLGRHVEMTALRRDGTEFPVELTINTSGHADCPIFTGFLRDITERKQARERLRLLAGGIESAGESILMTNTEGAIHFVNPAFTNLTGYTASEVIGKNPRILNSGQQSPQFYTQMWSTILAGKIWSGEIINCRKDGSRYDAQLTIAPVFDENQKIEAFIAVQSDLTERKQARERLEQSNQELAEKNLEMEQFVYIASHDLKSPLVTIQGFLVHLQRCLTTGRTDPMPGYLEHIEKATLRLHDTIEVLLELSRIGRIINKPEPVNLNQVIGTLLDEYRERLREMVVSIEVAENLPVIMADPKRLTQVIDNLLINAFKYACDGPHPIIHIEVEYAEDGVQVIVADEGPGIPEKDHNKIFHIFERLQPDSEGAGIGLAIVKKIIETTGGKVWVENSRSGGAAFHLSFPTSIIVPDLQSSPPSPTTEN